MTVHYNVRCHPCTNIVFPGDRRRSPVHIETTIDAVVAMPGHVRILYVHRIVVVRIRGSLRTIAGAHQRAGMVGSCSAKKFQCVSLRRRRLMRVRGHGRMWVTHSRWGNRGLRHGCQWRWSISRGAVSGGRQLYWR